MERNQIVALGKALVKMNPSVATSYSFNGENLSYEAMEETLRKEFNEIAGTYNLYRENKNKCFSLIEEIVSEAVPARAIERYKDFAEIKVFAQGDKPVFTQKIGRSRAKQFITRVGLAGIYEVFKLGTKSFELETSAVGGAAEIGFEEYLDGRVDFIEIINIVLEGIDEVIYKEIAKALVASIDQLPAANRVSAVGFDEDSMDKLIAISSAYGTPTIYCTREFASKMVPQTGWVSDNMRDALWNNGYIANYKGVRVVILPQSFTDETNSKKVIDPGYAWVFSSADKPVKIALEGDTHAMEREKDDWSRDIQFYQKVGVGVVMTNNIGSYMDTSLAGHLTWE